MFAFGVILVRIFPAFSRIRTSVFSPNAGKGGKDAEYLSVFSPNAVKCGKDAEYLSVFSPNAKKCGPE